MPQHLSHQKAANISSRSVKVLAEDKGWIFTMADFLADKYRWLKQHNFVLEEAFWFLLQCIKNNTLIICIIPTIWLNLVLLW